MIEQTRFISTVFLCTREFTCLEIFLGLLRLQCKDYQKIYSGVNFRGENVCGNFYSGNLFLQVARKIAKIENLELPRISCHTVGRYIPSLCNAAMLTVRRAINLICIFLSCGFYAIVI